MNRIAITLLIGTLSLHVPLHAMEQLVVISHPASSSVTIEEIKNAFLGRSFDLKAIDLPDGSPIRDQFYLKAMGRQAPQVKAIWARVIFTGKGAPPVILQDTMSVKRFVATTPMAIGYIRKSDVDNSVKIAWDIK